MSKNKLRIREGQRFNKLTIIKELPIKRLPSGQTNRNFLCHCDCGNIKEVRLVHLSRGRIRSCGCIKGELHGECRTKLYNSWRAMLTRCKESYFQKHLYFDRNITVYHEWRNSFLAFKKWALNNGFKEGLTIDRINNDEGYYPNNCRWATPLENCNNRRNTFIVNYNGKQYPFTFLIRIKKLETHSGSIRSRIKRGWEHEKAFNTPIRKGNYRSI